MQLPKSHYKLVWLQKNKQREDCQKGKCERAKEQQLKERRYKQNSWAVSDDVKREQRPYRLNKVGQPYRRITNRTNEHQSEQTQTQPHKHRYTNTPRVIFHQQTYIPWYCSVAIPKVDHLKFIQSHLIQTVCLYNVQQTKINVAAAFFCIILSLTKMPHPNEVTSCAPGYH